MPTTYAIPNGATVFAATTYTATGASLNVNNGANNPTGVTFQPDLVWAKSRDVNQSHYLANSVSGVNKYLQSDTAAKEQSLANSFTSFNSNGFTVGSSGAANASPYTYIAWQWQAGQGTTSSNTSGSITSTVSVNQTAGFSMVTFTANGSAGATVGHGLGVAPAFYIIKCKSNDNTDWMVYHQSLGASAFAYLDLPNAATTSNNSLTNGVAPSSTLITLGGSSNFNVNNYINVIYAWAAVPGFSAFGSYTGNGAADGPFVYCGFRPRFIMFKNTTGAGNNWLMVDTSRDTYNLTQNKLAANSSTNENNVSISTSSENNLDILSNGFKLRTSNAQNNGSSATIIYAAFAENPFKYANAR